MIKSRPIPPVGVKPRWLFLQERMDEITAAMIRYAEADHPAPQAWAIELRQRIQEYTDEIPR